jgi:hypothetical protein
MKTSEKQTPMQPMGGSKIPPPWFGAFLKNYMESMKDTVKESVENMKQSVVDSVRDLVKEEIEKARLKPEQNKTKKMMKKKKSKKINNKGVDHCFAGTLRNVVNLWIIYGY